MYMDLTGVMAKFPYVTGEEMPLADALIYMRECKIRHLPIVAGKSVIGVVSERDILSYKGQDKGNEITVGDIMSRTPFIVNQYESLQIVVDIMAKKKYGSALVTDDSENLVGIFTTTDALELLKRFLVDGPGFEKKIGKVVTLKNVIGLM